MGNLVLKNDPENLGEVVIYQPAISKHIRNIYNEGELTDEDTYSILEYMGNDGKQKYQIKYYNLDMILSIGYRINSKNAVAFRRWATTVLKEYMLKGYCVNQRLDLMEDRFDRRMTEFDKKLDNQQQKIDFFIRTSLPPVEGIFFDGQIYDAYAFVSELIRSADKRIILIDNYIDDTVLTMLNKRKDNVDVTIYTSRITKETRLDISKHNVQYRPIQVREFRKAHDRFLIIDDKVYLIGASIKDLGKKWFGFTIKV